jgi:putative transposase
MKYSAISRLAIQKQYPVYRLCSYAHVSHSAYYKWKKQPKSKLEQQNERIARLLIRHHEEHPEKGYRRLRDDLETMDNLHITDKRAYRICSRLNIQSVIKWKRKGCTRGAKDPMYVAENTLNRNFSAEAPNQKWLTDVTEFKYYVGPTVQKVYLSAILDLYDRRIVSYAISTRNDNALVMETFKAAAEAEPEAHPLLHSDRGYQYTSKEFHEWLTAYGMTHSMSRVGHCIDNGPMEGFWGILKRECYYNKRFTSLNSIVSMIENYIQYYNTKRTQRKLKLLTPLSYHEQFKKAG